MMILESIRRPFKDVFAYWRKMIFREQFSLDSFYEEVTDEKWKILTTHTSKSRHIKKSQSEVVTPMDEMLLMQTNVLSQIPECFGLSTSDGPTKQRDKFQTSRPPKTQVYLNKRPTNEPLIRAKSDEDRIRQLREKNKQKLKRATQSVDRNQPRRTTKPHVRFAEQTESITSQDHEEENPSGYTYQKTKSKIRLKTKTKIKRSNWKTKSAPVLRRMNNVEEELTSTTEFSHETNISFAAYVKKRTPNFNLKKSKSKSQKLKKPDRNGNINLLGFAGRDNDLSTASERNVTFNPIFQEDDCEKRKEMYELSRDLQSRDDHEHDHKSTRDDHVDNHHTTRDNSAKERLQARDNQNDNTVQPRAVHVRMSKNIEPNRYDNHVQVTCSDKQLNSIKLDNDVDDHVPITCIDGPYAEEYTSYENSMQESSVDSFHSFEEQRIDHVPVTCIDDVGDQNNRKDDTVRRPTLIRAGRIHDLDMCGWYDDDNHIDYTKLFYDEDYTSDSDDDDFTTRMLKRTAAILTFDMTTRRRELYTIDEEPEEE